MNIIPPIAITDAILQSSNVPETDYTEWSAVTAYVVGNTVMVSDAGVHKNYECLINNTNKYPPTYSSGATPEWLDLGATNRWRMFDGKVGNVTSKVNTISVELIMGASANAVALFGLSGITAQIVVDDPDDGEVYNQTISLMESPFVEDWYTYYFSDFLEQTEAVKTEVPISSAATVTITITAEAATAAMCGHVVIGKLKEIGRAKYGASVGILDYSRKDTDDFGNAIIVERKFAQTADYDVQIETIRVRDIQRTLAALRTTPIVWYADDNHPALTVYGWFKDFSIVIQNANISQCNISVEEFR